MAPYCRKTVLSCSFFNFAHEWGLLISVPGTSLSAGSPGASSSLRSCGVSLGLALPQESSCLPLQTTAFLKFAARVI